MTSQWLRSAALLAVDTARYNRANWGGLVSMTVFGVAMTGVGIGLLLAKPKAGEAPTSPPVLLATRVVSVALVIGGAAFLVYTWLFFPVTWL